MRNNKTSRRLLAAAIAMAVALPASATNGYFSHGYGTKSKAMAGAGVALSLDTLAPATNPAGLMDASPGFDIGMAYFAPSRGYEIIGAPTGACLNAQQCTFGIGTGSQSSAKSYFLIPHFGWAHKLSDDAAVGIAVYGNGGMNTRYTSGSATFGVPMGTVPPGVSFTAPGTFGNGTAGVDLLQLFVVPTYAHRIGENASIGISPIIAFQSFEARGLGNFAPFSSDPSHLTDNGHDVTNGYGLRVGVQVPFGESVRFGASYQTKIKMGRFKDYAGLFEGNGSFDIPANATIGAAFMVNDDLTIATDVQWIGYSSIDAIANPMFPNLFSAPLGADGGPGFGWDNMTVYKIGASYKTSAESTWRFGYSQGDQPIKSSEVLFSILAPGVVEQHFTVGYTHGNDDGNNWSLSAMYAPSKSVRGVNPLDPAQTIDINMHQFEIEFNYSFGH